MKEYSYIEKHMGTTVSLAFVCDNEDYADNLAQTTFATIHEYELRFSRFLPDSELTLLNQTGSSVVSQEFRDLLKLSLKLAEQTKQAFNPLVQVATLGYQTSFSDLPTAVAVTKETYDTDFSKITIDDKSNQVTLASYQKLDFGGVLKGYLAAKLADSIMESANCQGCIINIGGDLTTRGVDELHETFIFLLYNPITGEEIPVAIKDASLATSGTYARRWQTNQGQKHHIVDSTNQNNPAIDGMAVSVICTDGAMSEALTKLFLTKGETVAIATVSPTQYNYQYFFVTESGNIKSNIV